MMTDLQFDMLRRLAAQNMSCIELAPEITSRKIDIGKAPGVKIVQTLTKLGYARDYGNQHGRRVEIRLRIWGITDAGKAVLQMQALAENSISMKETGGQSQLSLSMPPKPIPPIKIKKYVRHITTNQLAEAGRKRKQTGQIPPVLPIPLFENESEKDDSP